MYRPKNRGGDASLLPMNVAISALFPAFAALLSTFLILRKKGISELSVP